VTLLTALSIFIKWPQAMSVSQPHLARINELISAAVDAAPAPPERMSTTSARPPPCGCCWKAALLRHTAGAITAAFGLIFLLPQFARALPSAWYQDAER